MFETRDVIDPRGEYYGRRVDLVPDDVLARNVVYATKMILDYPDRYGMDSDGLYDYDASLEDKSEALAMYYAGMYANEISRGIGYEFMDAANGITRQLAIMAKDYGYEGRVALKIITNRIISDLNDPESELGHAVALKFDGEGVWGTTEDLALDIRLAYSTSLAVNAEDLGVDLGVIPQSNHAVPEARLFNPSTSQRYRWASEQNLD